MRNVDIDASVEHPARQQKDCVCLNYKDACSMETEVCSILPRMDFDDTGRREIRSIGRQKLLALPYSYILSVRRTVDLSFGRVCRSSRPSSSRPSGEAEVEPAVGSPHTQIDKKSF